MKTLESVKNDVFASFADAQMSKEEMKMVKGGGNYICFSGPNKNSLRGYPMEQNYASQADADNACAASRAGREEVTFAVAR
ncbi:MAG: hypothetical protein EAZ44_04090 [Cytophagia bacterium]|nr:MAG: hypothetical protein EAZ44_04090 [Cytophagia bacterium]